MSNNMATYIRAEILQPLDVILLRWKGRAQVKLAKYLGGPYSHAVIVVNKTMRFNSVEEGIRFWPVEFSKCKTHNNHIYFLEKIDKYALLDVYRHNDLRDVSKRSLEKLQTDLIKTIVPFHLDQYPPLKTFHGIINGLRIDRRIISKIFTRVYDRVKESKIVPGPFCSELVSEIFKNLNLMLFSSDEKSELISPNDLAKSRLQKLEDETYKFTEANLEGMDELGLLECANTPYRMSKIATEDYAGRQKLLTAMPSEFFQIERVKELLLQELDLIIRDIGTPVAFSHAREALTPIEIFQLIFEYDKNFWEIIRKIERCLPNCGGINDSKQRKIFVEEMNKFYDKLSIESFCEEHSIEAKWAQNHINP